ncbi:MAG TPA: hypothetical protein VL832_25800 [Puia sp.]|jgi:hypothetical protein|nr:hypothetical protein [Puia sp.]
MNKRIILLFFWFPLLVNAQTDVLVLKKRGMEVRTYTIGSELTMKTIYNQWFQGTVTNMRNDSVFLNGMPFHYKEIAGIRKLNLSFGNTVLPAFMMVVGAGTFVLGAVNGLYRKDDTKDWYTTSGLISGAAFLVGGYLLTKTRVKTYRIGGKFSLDYLVIGAGPRHAQ